MNNWINTAVQFLTKSIKPIPQELNEIDWKSGLSDKSDRLAQHISAFANYPNGGYLAFGIGNDGSSKPLSRKEAGEIVNKLGNIARNNLAQPIGIEHAVTDFNGQPVLLIKIPENKDKPVHLRGSDIYNSYKRSAGQTVKLSRQEVKQLIAISTGLDFESQIAMYKVQDEEVLKLIDYDSYFTLQEKRLPDTKSSILQTLANEDLIRKSFQGWDILNLGAILFAKDLMSFNELKRKSVRVIVYKETSRGINKSIRP